MKIKLAVRAILTGFFAFMISSSNNALGDDFQVTTFSGPGPSVFGGNDIFDGYREGVGTEARFHLPQAIVMDRAGRTFVADTRNHVIRLIDTTGRVILLAGTPGEPGHDNGSYRAGINSNSKFKFPAGLALDESRNMLYVSDSGNHVIRKINLVTGQVSLFAGNDSSYSDPANPAEFRDPAGLALHRDANNVFIYVADWGFHQIRRISCNSAGQVQNIMTIAGSVMGDAIGTGPVARFNHPTGLALSPGGLNLYIADTYNHRIKLIASPASTSPRRVTNFAGTGMPGFTEFNDQTQSSGIDALSFGLYYPVSLISENSGVVRIAGRLNSGYSRIITIERNRRAYEFLKPNCDRETRCQLSAIARQPWSSPSIYAVALNSGLFKVDTGNGTFTMLAGVHLDSENSVFSTRSLASTASATPDGVRFLTFQGVAVKPSASASPSLLVAEPRTGSNSIRLINNQGAEVESRIQILPSTMPSNYYVGSLAVNSNDDEIFFVVGRADNGIYSSIYKKNQNGFSKVAGFEPGSTPQWSDLFLLDGIGSVARFFEPTEIVFDNNTQSLFVIDQRGSSIRKIVKESGGNNYNVSTLVSRNSQILRNAWALAPLSNRSLVVSTLDRLVKLNQDNGSMISYNFREGSQTGQAYIPKLAVGVATDSEDNIIFVETEKSRILVALRDGESCSASECTRILKTFGSSDGGSPFIGGSNPLAQTGLADGGSGQALFYHPSKIVSDRNRVGVVYVFDSGNRNIRKVIWRQ